MTTPHYILRTPPAQNISAVILSCTPLFTLPQQDDDGAGSIITGRRGGKEDFICFCFFSKQSISLHWASSQISVLAPAIPRAEVSGLSAERLCWCRAASSASDKAVEFYPLPKTGWGLGQGEKRLAQFHGGTWGQCLCHSTAPWARENKIPPCPGTLQLCRKEADKLIGEPEFPIKLWQGSHNFPFPSEPLTGFHSLGAAPLPATLPVTNVQISYEFLGNGFSWCTAGCCEPSLFILVVDLSL